MSQIAHCIGCNCHDFAACHDHATNQPCSWLAVDYDEGLGVCSACPGDLTRWNAGDREIAASAKGKGACMRQAKATEDDLDAASKVANALEGFQGQLWPEALDPEGRRPSFDVEDGEDAKAALGYLLEVARPASLWRVVSGMFTLLDPANRAVDPDADHLTHHPSRDAMLTAVRAVQRDTSAPGGQLSAVTRAMVDDAIAMADPQAEAESVVASRVVKFVMPVEDAEAAMAFIAAEVAPAHPGGPGGAHLQQLVGTACACWACLDARDARDASGWPIVGTAMIVCMKCGNKPCPHAANHANDCTSSNEPGQVGQTA